MRPTPEDLKILTEVWTKKTNELAVVIDETSKEIQDHAYYLGREQGHREERDRCVNAILNGSQFFLAGIEPEMREAVVRRALGLKDA